MIYDDILISSDNFIALLIKLLQIRLGEHNSNANYLTSVWYIDSRELSTFIQNSKMDAKYSSFLRCFNFRDGHSGSYSVELVTALNRAKAKNMLTANADGIYYISRIYNNDNILYTENEWVSLMNDFIEDFYFYLEDPRNYLKTLGGEPSFASAQIDFERNIFNLQRTLRTQERQSRFSKDNE